MNPLGVPYGYCYCGCGQQTPLARQTARDRGHVRGEPVRFVHGHSGHGTGPYYVINDNGCWEWVRKRDRTGYGRLRRSKRDWLAHRWMYERLKGPVPPGRVLDHLCRNRACVNPDHLEVTTDAINIRRGDCAKFTEADITEIRRRAAGMSGSQREIARKLGDEFATPPHRVRAVLQGRTWAS